MLVSSLRCEGVVTVALREVNYAAVARSRGKEYALIGRRRN